MGKKPQEFRMNNTKFSNNKNKNNYTGYNNINDRAAKNMTFVNPYNFIEADLMKTTKYPLKNNEKKNSGYISCKLIARTPILIPDYIDYDKIPKEERGEAPKEHKFADFMHIKKEKEEKFYFIPGSSLRGVIRNVYETITDSCFSTLINSKMLSSRTATASKPGILVKEGENWCLYKAKEYNINKIYAPKINSEEDEIKIEIFGEKFFSGDAVKFENEQHSEYKDFVDPKNIKKGNKNDVLSRKNKREGFVVIGAEPNVSKVNRHYNKIFTFEDSKPFKVFKEENECWLSLVNTVKDYGNEKINQKLGSAGHHGYRYFDKNRDNGVIPVWINEGKKLYLQPACMGRRTYYNSFEKLIKEKKPCELNRKNENWDVEAQLCPACNLFGTARDDSKGGKLRFTDAVKNSGNISNSFETLSILSAPKPTYLQFYADFQNITPADGYDDDGVKIRGRKFYLHSDDFKKLNENVAQSNQNMSAKIAKKNSEFSFKIYFENLTKKELSTLLWAITIGENDRDGKYCHKIGHGKPIGMGSAKIIIESVVIRNFNENGYTEDRQEAIDIKLDSDISADKSIIDEFKFISDFELAKRLNNKKEIHYPDGGFKWEGFNAKLNKKIEPLMKKYSKIIKDEHLV